MDELKEHEIKYEKEILESQRLQKDYESQEEKYNYENLHLTQLIEQKRSELESEERILKQIQVNTLSLLTLTLHSPLHLSTRQMLTLTPSTPLYLKKKIKNLAQSCLFYKLTILLKTKGLVS